MSENKNAIAGLWVFLLAALAGVLVTVCGLLGFAAWMTAQHASGSMAAPLATAAVGIGSCCSGWLAAFCKRERGLLCGAVQGVLFAALLFVLAVPAGIFAENAVLLRFAAVVLCGSLGGFLGVRCRGKKKFG